MGDEPGTVRRSRRVVAAVVVAVGVLVVGAFAVPRLVGGDASPAASAPRTDCVAEADAPTSEIGVQAATWVRFCPLADEAGGQRLRHPQGVVTGDVATAIAETLWESQVDRPVCDPLDVEIGTRPSGAFRIEVGLADGRVADLLGDNGCSTRDALLFSQLETTLLMGAVDPAAPPVAPPDPVTCPDRLTTTTTNHDGDSAGQLVESVPSGERYWLSTVPLLPQPAVAADVCAYTGLGGRLRLVDQWQADAAQADLIRATATVAHRRGAQADCDLDPKRPSYVVVLSDTTGTARTLTLDGPGCGVLAAAIGTPPEDTWLGLATNELADVVAASRPAA
jgi:hypothetical protein